MCYFSGQAIQGGRMPSMALKIFPQDLAGRKTSWTKHVVKVQVLVAERDAGCDGGIPGASHGVTRRVTQRVHDMTCPKSSYKRVFASLIVATRLHSQRIYNQPCLLHLHLSHIHISPSNRRLRPPSKIGRSSLHVSTIHSHGPFQLARGDALCAARRDL